MFGIAKVDRVRSPSVTVETVAAKRRNFRGYHRLAIRGVLAWRGSWSRWQDPDHAKGGTEGQGSRSSEYLANRIGSRIGRDVVVLGLLAEQRVTDTTPGEIGSETSLVKRFDDTQGFGRSRAPEEALRKVLLSHGKKSGGKRHRNRVERLFFGHAADHCSLATQSPQANRWFAATVVSVEVATWPR